MMSTKTVDSDPEFTLGAVPSEMAGEAGRSLSTRQGTSSRVVAAFAALALVVGAVAFYFFWPRSVTPPQQVALSPPASTPAAGAQLEPAIQHPVEKIPGLVATDAGGAQFPLPTLDESDIVTKGAIETIFGRDAVVRFLVPTGIIRHIVATVDSLPRKMVAAPMLPIKSTPGAFVTTSTAGRVSIANTNAGRYSAYIKAVEGIDTRLLAGFYVRLYPLFQQAYVELGYPNGYFNDRLIGVIDHLLAAPEPRGPAYLYQPKVLFEFADPELEELSAGQKILVRIGIENEKRLKAKLRDIREALTADAAVSSQSVSAPTAR
jgi:hypothetical protein